MAAPRRLQLRRGNTAATSTYVGAPGELIVNTTTNTLYLHDGVTVGGIPTTVNVSTITTSIVELIANAAVQAGNIATLTSNAAVQAGSIATLTSNAAVQAGNIAVIFANLGAVSGNLSTLTDTTAWLSGDIATLYTNAGVQSGSIATITANLGSVAGSLATLTANAAVQAGLIANAQGTYSNANVASYLPTYSGNIGNINLSSNLGATAGTLTTLTSNAAVQAGNIATIFANLGAVSGSLSTLTANAGAQAGSIATITANLGAVSGSLATLTSNAAVQAGLIAGLSSGSTYANTNVASYLSANLITTAITTQANISTTGYFLGNGALLTGIVAGAGTTYSNSNVASYLPTYSGNVANIRLGVSGVLTFADGTTQTTAGGGSYSNVNVTTFLAGSSSTSFGNTSTHTLNSNVTQIFIGNSTSLTSGNSTSPFATALMYNMYFAANNTPLVRNTQLGAGILSLDLNGFTVSGLATSQTANSAPTLTNLLRITSTGAATFVGTVTTNAGLTSVGAIAVNSALGITSNQATQLIFNQTVTTITMGGSASTINLGTTTGTAGNVFVGSVLGTNNYNLKIRANGQYNLVTSLNSSGGYATTTYSNIAVTGGSGTGMIISMNGVASGYLGSANITNPGTGYVNGDTITIPAGNPVGSLGGSFVLQNYNANRSSAQIGTGIWTYHIEGNLTAPGNITIASNSSYFIGNALGTTATYTGNVAAANLLMSSRTVKSTSTTVDLFDDTTLNINAFGAATDINIGVNNAAARFGIKTPNIWFDNLANLATYSSNINVFNTTATGVNAFGAANTIVFGANTSSTTFRGNVTAGNLITGGALYVANITTTGASGNISGANYITANVILTNGGWGNISNVAFLTANTITTTGNVTVGGNLTITGTKSNVPVKTGGFVAQNTAVSIDSITAQWLNTGAASANQLSLAALNGNVSILYTYTFQDGTGGSTTGGSSSTTLANLSFGWTSIGNPSGVAGDMYNVLVTLPGTNAYRITAMTGSGYSNNVLTIERLV